MNGVNSGVRRPSAPVEACLRTPRGRPRRVQPPVWRWLGGFERGQCPSDLHRRTHMTLAARPSRARSRIAVVAIALIAMAMVVTPGSPATASDRVTAKGTLGLGYWMVATDGGIFTHGQDAATGPEFFGS